MGVPSGMAPKSKKEKTDKKEKKSKKSKRHHDNDDHQNHSQATSFAPQARHDIRSHNQGHRNQKHPVSRNIFHTSVPAQATASMAQAVRFAEEQAPTMSYP